MSASALLTARPLAVFSLVAELGIHLFLAPDHLREMPYMGWLFVASAVIITAVLVGLNGTRAARSASYGVGAVACFVMFGGFVASRTMGLPMGYREGWLADDALGIPSLAFEVIFIACAALALGRHDDGAHHHSGQVGLDEPGAVRVHLVELRATEVVGLRELGHDARPSPKATPRVSHALSPSQTPTSPPVARRRWRGRLPAGRGHGG